MSKKGKKLLSTESNLSRRNFMKNATYLGVATTGLLVAACNKAAENPASAPVESNHMAGHEHGGSSAGDIPRNIGLMFFSNITEAKALAYAAERIFPEDENGPGALKLGVIYFIDNQCAAGWGVHAREYMNGPFKPGVEGQGYQSPVLRRDVLKYGAQGLLKEANKRYQQYFYDLTGEQQDAILKDMEAGKIQLESNVSSKYFFSTLKSITIAGVFSDPIYNGNRNMEGWKMKKYPGAQMMYSDTIMEEAFQNIEPVSLAEMQGIE